MSLYVGMSDHVECVPQQLLHVCKAVLLAIVLFEKCEPVINYFYFAIQVNRINIQITTQLSNVAPLSYYHAVVWVHILSLCVYMD